MEEMKHTPGPWRIGTAPPNGEQTIGTIRGMMVAVATTGVGMEEETLANASLIAAAPEMLEALQSLVNQFLQRGVFTDPEHPDRIALALAESAIAKATGGAA